MSVVKYLQSQIRLYQDRCGPPGLDDIRARGVSAQPHMLKYLRDRGWECAARDTGEATTLPWQRCAPHWTLDADDDGHTLTLEIGRDVDIVRDLAALEDRSPWAILEEMAEPFERSLPRPLWYDGIRVATQIGSTLTAVGEDT